MRQFENPLPPKSSEDALRVTPPPLQLLVYLFYKLRMGREFNSMNAEEIIVYYIEGKLQ